MRCGGIVDCNRYIRLDRLLQRGASWQTDLLDDTLSNRHIVMGDLILAEILQGFRRDKDFETAKRLLAKLPIHHLGGYRVAIQSARNYRRLRKLGVTVKKTIAMLIGTYCIMEQLPLLHNDRDFEPLVAHCGLETCALP